MAEPTSDDQMPAYSEAVKSGLYAKRSGLTGKYDNVRRYWEDELTRHFLYPHLRKLIERSRGLMRRIRILDLGCGSADGYELLCGIRERDPDLQAHEVDLLTPDVFGLYKGIDLNEDLLAQARKVYGGRPKLTFAQGDFTKGLPIGKDERAFDLYFTSFGTMSHRNRDSTAIRLLADIAARVEHYAVIICDWLGRYTFVGRHMDTAEYNPHAQPIRKAVNSLHEPNLRTDLNDLIINYVPKPGFDFLNDYFEHLQMCWNALVHHTAQLLVAYDPHTERLSDPAPPIPGSYPEPLREMMDRMRHVVEGTGWMRVGLPRENIIEPQLGYALRHLVRALQDGRSCAHGYVGILEVDRDSA